MKELESFAENLYLQLKETEIKLNGMDIPTEAKSFLQKEIDNIREAVANPEGGLAKIMESVKNLNDKL